MSMLIGFEVILPSPFFLTVAIIIHVIIAVIFFKGYRHYHALHRLILRNQGALFLVAISNMIEGSRIKALRNHYRLRKCQGLVLAGQPLEALRAIAEYRHEVQPGRSESLDILAAESEANLQLGELEWSRRALTRAQNAPGYEKHDGLRAISARLEAESGQTKPAIGTLEDLKDVRQFPVTPVIRARNHLWLSQVLERDGQTDQAKQAREAAIEAAPESHYAQLAARPW